MLSPDEQAECISHLPSLDLVYSHEENGGQQPKLVDSFFANNTSLQEAIRTFQVTSFLWPHAKCIQEDLSEGRFQSSYLQRAALARERRLRGDFDKWKVVSTACSLTQGRSVRALVGPESEISL
jgi:Asx homology domain